MITTDYTKEVGMDSGQRRVPLPYAIALIVLLIVGGWYGVHKLNAGAHHADANEPKAPAASAAVQPS